MAGALKYAVGATMYLLRFARYHLSIFYCGRIFLDYLTLCKQKQKALLKNILLECILDKVVNNI